MKDGAANTFAPAAFAQGNEAAGKQVGCGCILLRAFHFGMHCRAGLRSVNPPACGIRLPLHQPPNQTPTPCTTPTGKNSPAATNNGHAPLLEQNTSEVSHAA
jgi:hypothetical protein